MRFAASLSTIFFALLALRTPPAAAAATQIPLETLLAKARVASGAPYRYHVVSRSHENDDGHEFDVTTETEGLKYRARKCAGALCVSGFYFDGERSFNSNFNDTALPLSARVDGLQITLRAIASYAFTAPGFRSDGGQIQDRDAVLRDGKKYRRISVAPKLGALLDAVIDPESGLVVGVISDERRLAFEFRDQRTVGGRLKLPYAVYLNGAEIERFDDRTIDPQPLAAPPGIAPQLAGSVTVGMTRPDAPLVPCTIGGQSVVCLFDTGNSGLAMSPELAAKLRLKPQTGGVVGTADGTISGVAKAPALAVGGASFPSAWYVVLGGIHAAGYDVVLGADAFAHARVTLDFAKRSVTLAAADPGAAGGIPLDFDNFVPNAGVTLGAVSVPLALDTGDTSTLELAADFAAAHAGAASATSIRLGNARLDGSSISTTSRLSAPARGVVGSGFFAHFISTFDYARGRLTLVPRAGDGAAKSDAT
jgi:hypothetical protein